jgi:hypothetical protein
VPQWVLPGLPLLPRVLLRLPPRLLLPQEVLLLLRLWVLPRLPMLPPEKPLLPQKLLLWVLPPPLLLTKLPVDLKFSNK